MENNYRWLSKSDINTNILVDFFIQNVDEKYISHGEVLDNRAVDFNTWSPDLRNVLTNEFDSAYENDGDEYTKICVCEKENRLIGLAYLGFHEKTYTVVLQDLIINKNNRSEGIGNMFLHWIESESIKMGLKIILLESGVNNTRAHDFYEKLNYEKCSIVMIKKLVG